MCYNDNGEHMKKIFILLSLFLLVGCTNKIKEANCKIDLKNNDEGYTLKASYRIYYDKNEYVTKIESKEKYKSNSDEVLKYFYKVKSIENANIYNYGGFEYSVEQLDDIVNVNAILDLEKADVKKMIIDKVIKKDYTSSRKITLYGIKEYYEAKGAVCDIE